MGHVVVHVKVAELAIFKCISSRIWYWLSIQADYMDYGSAGNSNNNTDSICIAQWSPKIHVFVANEAIFKF